MRFHLPVCLDTRLVKILLSLVVEVLQNLEELLLLLGKLVDREIPNIKFLLVFVYEFLFDYHVQKGILQYFGRKSSKQIGTRLDYLLQMQSGLELNVIGSSDEQDEKEEVTQVEIGSFAQQLPIQVREQIIDQYDPLAIIYSSINSIIVKAKASKETKYRNGRQISANSLVAIKFTPLAVHEGQVLEKINQANCLNIVKCYQVFEDALILKYYDGDLQRLIYGHQNMDSQIAMKILEDCLAALLTLNQMKIIHFDIKPGNILHQSTHQGIKRFVLADFANSRTTGEKFKMKVEGRAQLSQSPCLQYTQTWQYLPPEVLTQTEISSKVDLWGVGCVLFECMTGQCLLPVETVSNSYQKYLYKLATEQQIKNRLNRFSFPSQIQLFEKLLVSLLKFNPAQRIGLAEFQETIGQLRKRQFN